MRWWAWRRSRRLPDQREGKEEGRMVRLLSRRDVEEVLSMEDCMTAVESGFAALARGEAKMPQRAAIPVEDHKGLFLGMPAYIGGAGEALGLKVVTVYPNNPGRYDLPTTLGTLLLCDPATGKVMAIMDAGYLTAMRTGAASGVATKYLAREDAAVGTLFGAGVQARKQVEAVHLARPLKKLYVLDISPEARDRLIQDLGQRLGIEMEPTDDAQTAVKEADVIITATSSPEPIFDGRWLQPGVHVNNIGSHSPKARELDTTTVKRSRFIADLKEANLVEAGDILLPIAEGAVGPEHIQASLGEIVIGEKPGRTAADEITVFKSCGLAIQDMATALAVYRAAEKRGVGREVEI
ncbi:MAG: ornithine cyclodeaminase [Candidatus Eisenbacteria bacterium]|nr:ornithine cyclodeaminase [Candidatus Eisenbacteria bacterium]